MACSKRSSQFRTSVLWLALVALAAPAAGQQFVNLDFEQASVPDPLPPDFFPFLPWEQAAPGWSHSAGDSTDLVNYQMGHLGFSQSYVLLHDQDVFGSEGGSFSMEIGSGYLHSQEPHGEWIQAFLAQRGTVPEGTVELRLLSSSHEFKVQIDGVPIQMVPQRRDVPVSTYSGAWSGDVSSFAGRVVDLRIVNNAGNTRIAIDNIIFMPIPEPSTWVLFAAGMGAVFLRVRRTRSFYSTPAAEPPQLRAWPHHRLPAAGEAA